MTLRLSTCLGACALAAAVSLSFVGMRATAAGVAVRVQDAKPAPTQQAPQRRFIVRYRTGTLQRSSTTAALDAARAAVVRSGIAASIPGLTVRHVRRMGSGADVIALSRSLDSAATASLLSALASDPNVASVTPDRRLYHTGIAAPTMLPNDPLSQQYQWHFYNSVGGIKAPAAWDSATGTGVVVAVLDTGVTDHPDLSPNLLQGYDFISDAFISRRATDERVPGAHDYGDWNDDFTQCEMSNSSFHGTHTAGTVAEVSNNGIGLAGVAHGAKVLPVRVLGRCGGYTSDIADAIVWASGGTVPGVPANANPAEVINMSLGGQFLCEESMQSAIDTAVANGTTVVVSAGNSNANASEFSPASCNNVITVGASRITGGKAFYSNFGKKVDLSAPGGGGGQDGGAAGYVWQTLNDSATAPELGSPAYGGMAGTSMAAPHVAAVAALVQGKASTPLTPAQMETMLKATARRFPVTIPTNQPMGTGILDAKAAVATVLPPCQGPDCETAARPLVNKTPAKGLSGAANAQLSYVIDVPIGASALSFMTYGGTGDVTLLVRYAQVPTTTAYDLSSVHAGNNETIRVPVTRGGLYYVKVVGAKAFTAVTLEARHN
ncbi:S8 family serine peptidase [Noviluteimonas gilva]|uniref:S8 family serine peptidase n=1 Tax=Noviluteimonas gilva TaxID=2682097 RepID=A0A7C9HQV4_9GAMM|nr:S8 family serine peptidase [Lysobacter gilvus]MUV13453.1 S8 family serine peptidase [Lysobacter gilvus]